MENFNWTQFVKRIYVKTDLQSAYDFWTKSSELEKWFLSKSSFFSAKGERIDSFESVEAGSKYSWNWFAQNYHEEGTVILANGKDCIHFTFAGDCRVEVKLTEVNAQVIIELTQTEIPIDNHSKKDIRLGCAFGWTFYLINLKSVLEGGLDLRNKDADLTGVINN